MLILVMTGRGSDSCRGNLSHQGLHPARPVCQEAASRIDAALGLDHVPPRAALAPFRHCQVGGRIVHLDDGVGVAHQERLGYGAREMLLRRPFEMTNRAVLAVAMLVAVPP